MKKTDNKKETITIELPRKKSFEVKDFIKSAEKVYKANRRDEKKICEMLEETGCGVCLNT